MKALPSLLFADCSGEILSHPILKMAVSGGNQISRPSKEELIAMPKGSSLFYLPGRYPVGFNPLTQTFESLKQFQGKKVFAVAAFLIPAYLRLHNPALERDLDKSNNFKNLPLWAYSACGFYAGRFYVAAQRIDKRIRQSPRFYDSEVVSSAVKKRLSEYPENRLYRHLGHCALNYNCLAAKNLFLQRWEAPLPTSQACNARCLGCLSYQVSDCLSSHQRINFKPTVNEIVEIGVRHLQQAKESIVSFGQGCEGEPLLEAKVIEAAVKTMRNATSRGTIHMNTNASIPKAIDVLSSAGIDSFRVSLISVRQNFYHQYFRPKSYCFWDVMNSIKIAKKNSKFVSINLLVFPGFTDSRQEVNALLKFIEKTRIDMIQWRNLNIDPDYFTKNIPFQGLKPQGILKTVRTVKKEFPKLKMGYFNLPKEQF